MSAKLIGFAGLLFLVLPACNGSTASSWHIFGRRGLLSIATKHANSGMAVFPPSFQPQQPQQPYYPPQQPQQPYYPPQQPQQPYYPPQQPQQPYYGPQQPYYGPAGPGGYVQPPPQDILPAIGTHAGTISCDGGPSLKMRVKLMPLGLNTVRVDSTTSGSFSIFSCSWSFSGTCQAQEHPSCPNGAALICDPQQYGTWSDNCFGTDVPRTDLVVLCYYSPGARSLTLVASQPTCSKSVSGTLVMGGR